MRHKIIQWTCLLSLLSIPIVAFAQVAAGDPTLPEITKVFAAFVAAIKAGQWPMVAVLALVAVVWGLRTFGGKWIPWLTTSEGGTVLAFLTALAATLGAAALGGTSITWGLVGTAFVAAFTAMGAWTGVRRLLRVLVPLATKISPALGKFVAFLSGVESDAPAVPTPQA